MKTIKTKASLNKPKKIPKLTKNLWNPKGAKGLNKLDLRVYSSNLLGQNQYLTLHGGGNTSLKESSKNIYGQTVKTLFIKASGSNLKTCTKNDFTALDLNELIKIFSYKSISDLTLIKHQQLCQLHPSSKNASVEALLHAIIPYKWVDHTHADCLIALTNNKKASTHLKAVYGDEVLVIPYIMPGFQLAKYIFNKTKNFKKIDWQACKGIVLMNHGLLAFSDTSNGSYENMIQLVEKAENYLNTKKVIAKSSKETHTKTDLLNLSILRKQVSTMAGNTKVVKLNATKSAIDFSNNNSAKTLLKKGPITSDYVVRLKPMPAFINSDFEKDLAKYSLDYQSYFDKHKTSEIVSDLTPRWALWKNNGAVTFGDSAKEAQMRSDLVSHTIDVINWAEKLGGYKSISEKHSFDMEYWPPQIAKLKNAGNQISKTLQGKIAIVTGGASGIGKACIEELLEQGACVAGLDINPNILSMIDSPNYLGLVCNMKEQTDIKNSIDNTVANFGGLDIIISNAGIFTAGQKIEDLDENFWDLSMDINLKSNFLLLKHSIKYLKNGIDPSIIFIASRNVPAPGPGAAAYSVAKAGQTQLGRVAALELGASNVRVNTLHPDAVFDTGLWTKEALEKSAKRYGLTVDQYKSKNILKAPVKSLEVAKMCCALASTLFAKTTGAQIPIDGGNDRVI